MRTAALAAAATAALLTPHFAHSQSLGGAVGNATGAVGGAVGSTAATVGGAVGSTGATVGGAVGSAGGAVGGPVGGAAGTVGGAVGGVSGSVGGAIGSIGGAAGNVIGGVGGATGGGGASGGIGGAGGGFGGGFGGAAGGIAGGGFGAGAAVGALSNGPATTASISGGAGIGSGTSTAFASISAIRLPAALAPCDGPSSRRREVRTSPCGPRYTAFFPEIGSVSGTREDLEGFRVPLRGQSGTPQQVVQNCRAAIVAAALPYGVVRVDAASAGPMRSARGGFAAPVTFKIVYNRSGGLETRQATINCRLNTAGRVIAAA